MSHAAEQFAARLRPAAPEDASAIQAIYAHYVMNGFASFELEPPNVDEMRARVERLLDAGYPYIVAEAEGMVGGFAYAGSYRPRPAYRYTVEDSVYVASAFTGRGIGRLLLENLIRQCTTAGYRQMVAVIGDSGNRASIKLHERCGFARAGVITDVGWKHERWVDTVIMQRALGSGDGTPPDRP